MKFFLIFGALAIATPVMAADNKPLEPKACVSASKGCGASQIKAQCAQLACRLAGCEGEDKYGKGECKTMSDEYDLAMCDSLKSTKKCDTTKPFRAYFPNLRINPNQVFRAVEPPKRDRPIAPVFNVVVPTN